MEPLGYYKGRVKTYYEVSLTVAIRNVKLRYKNSILGFLWTLINPLLYLAIFIVIFNHAFPIENYPLYALTGLIFWTFFASTSVQILTSIIDSAGILKSLSVPPVIFPISFLLSSLINFLLSLIPFLLLMLFFGFRPSAISLLAIPGILLFSVFIFGFSLILAAFNVFFRDVGMFYNTITPALFYMTPIAYPVDQIPEKFKYFIMINPIYHFILYFREILCYNNVPDLSSIAIITAISLTTGITGIMVFNSLKKGFISHL